MFQPITRRKTGFRILFRTFCRYVYIGGIGDFNSTEQDAKRVERQLRNDVLFSSSQGFYGVRLADERLRELGDGERLQIGLGAAHFVWNDGKVKR